MAYPLTQEEAYEFGWDGPGVQPYSARGLTHAWEWISQAGVVRRTVNGGLVDRSAAQFRLIRYSVSGDDRMAPAFDGLYPGTVLNVQCGFWIATQSAPLRPTVDSYTYGGWTFYRPALSMMVMPGSPKATYDEYGARTGWQVDLEEVQVPA